MSPYSDPWNPDSRRIDELASENERLRSDLDYFETRLLELEARVADLESAQVS